MAQKYYFYTAAELFSLPCLVPFGEIFFFRGFCGTGQNKTGSVRCPFLSGGLDEYPVLSCTVPYDEAKRVFTIAFSILKISVFVTLGLSDGER